MREKWVGTNLNLVRLATLVSLGLARALKLGLHVTTCFCGLNETLGIDTTTDEWTPVRTVRWLRGILYLLRQRLRPRVIIIILRLTTGSQE